MSEQLLQYKKLGEGLTQACPLCGMKQQIWVKGFIPDKEKGLTVAEDGRGYSFCNCRNIFFTDWSNIDQKIYDDKYVAKYELSRINEVYNKTARLNFPILKKINPNIKSFFELGAVNDYLLDNAVKEGWSVTGLDIAPRDSIHPIIIEDFDKFVPDKQYDVIWASHVIEHLKDPIAALKKCYSMLNPGGLLYIALPDPYFIPWEGPGLWPHWVLTEHHIMWDMGSLIELCLELGFNFEFSRRYSGIEFNVMSGDFHVIVSKNK